MKLIDSLIQRLAKSLPGLATKLRQAEIVDNVEHFLHKTIMIALYATAGYVVFMFLTFSKVFSVGKLLLLSTPVVLVLVFFYLMRIPDAKIMRKVRDINSEIVFAGRFLIIELESGVPLYDAFTNITKNYPTIGKYFSDIVNKVDLGTQMEDALNETIETTPSPNFRKILWQIVNSQHTGADMSTALRSVVDNITKEQMIEIKEYGRKLNPLAMFYMIIAVILPSIGITMFIVLTTFLDLSIGLVALLSISVFLAFIQFMFLAMIKSSRPAVDL